MLSHAPVWFFGGHRGVSREEVKMAQTGRKRTASGRSKSGAGDKALERLHQSVDAAEAALKDVRSEMSRGSRDLVKDLEKALRDARKNLRRVSRRISKDLEGVQKAVTGNKATTRSKPAQRRSGGARSASSRRRTSAKK
jgi:ABC-type transporter Mla subunit MlaD